MVAVLMLGALLLVPAVVQQVSALIDTLPHYFQRVRTSQLYRFLEERFHLERATSGSPETLRATATPALKALGSIVFLVGAGVSVLFLTVFMLIFGGPLVSEWMKEATAEHRLHYERVVRKIYESVGGYMTGLSFVCLVNATLTTTFLACVRVPFFLPLGILSGFSSLIPYGGPITAGAGITLIALATKGPWAGVATFVYYCLYEPFEGHVLSPLIFRRTVHVNPLITLLAILFFAELAGIPGAVIAVPTAAAGQIILREVLASRRERQTAS
jgi:predicted PurR-regulated permease PerM